MESILLNKYELENKIYKFIKEGNRELDNLNGKLLLYEEAELESFDLIMLLSDIEEEFGIQISMEKMNGVRTIHDLVNYILDNSQKV